MGLRSWIDLKPCVKVNKPLVVNIYAGKIVSLACQKSFSKNFKWHMINNAPVLSNLLILLRKSDNMFSRASHFISFPQLL